MAFTQRDHAIWIDRIRKAKQQQADRHAWWKRSLDLYSMEFWRQSGFSGQLTDDVVPVNYATTFILTRIASLYARNPKIFIRPRPGRWRMQAFAETMERELEWFWDEAELKDVFIEVLRDALLFGIGWIETGYTASLKALPPPQVVDEEREQADTLRGLFDQLKDVMGSPKPEPQPSQQGVLEPHQQEGDFYAIRRSPYMVLLAEGFQRIPTMPYLILWDRLKAEDFLRHPRYQYKEAAIFASSSTSKLYGEKFKTADYTFPASATPADLDAYGITDSQYLDLYTIWDRRSMQVFTLSERCVLPHMPPTDWPDLAEGWPVIDLTFATIPDTPETASPYPFGALEPIMGQIVEKSNIRQSMVEHRRRANIIVFTQKGPATEEDVTKYATASGAADVVPVTNPEAIKLGPQIVVPTAAFDVERAIDSDLDRDSMMQLALDPSAAAKTDRATVANIIQGNANLGTVFAVDRIETCSKRVARRITQLFWQYKSRIQVGEDLGELPPPEAWPSLPRNLELARRRVSRELELRVEAGSTRPIQDDVLDREQFIRMIATVQATSPRIYKQVERQVIALLAKRFREPALEAAVLRVLDDEEAQGAQVENQLLAQGHPQYVSPGEDHETHIRAHMSVPNPTPLHLAHIKAHEQRMQELAAGQVTGGQGVRQATAAPSAAEVSRMGAPTMSDVEGQGFNLRKGTGQEAMVP